jgi:hypothetical protein
MPRINPYKQAVYTRKLYRFEEEFFNTTEYKHLSRQRSLKWLLKLAHKVWKGEKIERPLPEIRFGNGAGHKNKQITVSWCDGNVIELAPYQRDVVTLLHEMAHAVGNYLHNHRFVEVYVNFLVKYAKVNKKELLKVMQMYNVDLPRKYKLM